MRITTQGEGFAPRIVVGEAGDHGQGALRIKGTELYAQALVIGQDVTLEECQGALEDVSSADVPSYDGNAIATIEMIQAIVEIANDDSPPPSEELAWSPGMGFLRPGTIVVFGQGTRTDIEGDVHEIIGERYEVIQLHAAQVGWEPPLVPALFKRVAAPSPGGGPPEWVKPTGGHDAYKQGDKVTFQGKVYESLINGNVWSPTEHAAGWKLA